MILRLTLPEASMWSECICAKPWTGLRFEARPHAAAMAAPTRWASLRCRRAVVEMCHPLSRLACVAGRCDCLPNSGHCGLACRREPAVTRQLQQGRAWRIPVCS